MSNSDIDNIPQVSALGKMFENASSVQFIEGSSPYLMAQSDVSRLDASPVTREEIENFVRNTAPQNVAEKLETISKKTREDYPRFGFGTGDDLFYSITTDDFSYRCNYSMGRNGTHLIIRRVPKPSSDGL